MKRILISLALALCGGALAGQEISISTNIADYANALTLNMEASYGLARHWSVNAGLKYNPFSYGEGESSYRRKQRSYSVGARFWPWYIYSGWWFGAKMQYQEFSETGGRKGTASSEGDRVGPGLAAGYSRMLGKHFNLDFGLGLWAGYMNYTTYSCPTCGRRTDSGGRAFVLPNDILVGVNYIF